MTTTAEFIAGFEGYAGRAYWDVNAYRLGYGSDTEGPDQIPVTEGMETTKARALQNLALRIPEFQREAIHGKTGIGLDTWEKLTNNQRAAITSIVYNYGRLPIVVTLSDPDKTAAAIRALQTANGGVNRKRRLAEAAFYLTADGAAPQPAPQAPIPHVPGPQAPPLIPPMPAPPAGHPPLTPSAARRAALAVMLSTMVDQIAAEQSALNDEITELRGISETLAKRNPTNPLALPAPPVAKPQGTKPMFVNWKTTLSGLVAAGAQGVAATFPQYAMIAQIVSGLALAALGVSAKDKNVTGGTIQQ